MDQYQKQDFFETNWMINIYMVLTSPAHVIDCNFRKRIEDWDRKEIDVVKIANNFIANTAICTYYVHMCNEV